PWIVAIMAVPLLVMPSDALARTWHIVADGSGDAPTIQAGIDSAMAGDSVLVAPGIYLENIDFMGKEIVVKSNLGHAVTTIDGSSRAETVVLMNKDEESGTILEGFTITGGRGHVPGVTQARGGGLFMQAISPIIRRNYFFKNEAAPNGIGGGIFLGSASDPAQAVTPLFEDNIFQENHAELGGAMGIVWGQPSIHQNKFIGNSCDFDGGAIFVWMNEGAPIIDRNEFWENFAPDHGGAMDLTNTFRAGKLRVTNNLFVRNRAWGTGNGDTGSGGGLYVTNFSGCIEFNTFVSNQGFGESLCGGGGIALDVTPPGLVIESNVIAYNNSCGLSCRDNVTSTVGQNIFWQNENGDLGRGSGHCPVEWEDRVIIGDPLFCDLDADDYRLASNSPAIGMGAFPFPQCGPVDAQKTTWGRIKVLYTK
ncbi:MAG: DUF1565 domain-containing protein, partial [Nitrospira sp.]|nr:DUF1565 domain-containing protein [Nitrospira sp.]